MRNKTAYLWGGGTKVAPTAIQLLTNAILARFLTPNDFGTIGVLSVFFLVANVLVDSGLGGSLVKEKQISTIDCTTIGTFNLIISLIIYSILFILAPYIELYFEILNLSQILKLLALTFVIGSLGLVPKALLIRELRFREICIITIVSVLLSSIVSIMMAMNNYGVYSLVCYQLLFVFISSILSAFATKYVLTLGFNVNSFKRLFSFGFFTTVTSVIDSVYENLLTILVGKYVDIRQAGYLSQAKKLEEGSTTSVAITITNVSFPLMTKLKDDKIKFTKEADSLLRNVIKYIFPVLLLIAFFSEQIVTLLFGQQWMPSSFYLKILTFAGMLLIVETLIRSYIKSLCEVKLLMNITLFKRVVGVAVLISLLLIDPELLIYGYVLNCFIGLIVNLIAYTKIMQESLFRYCCNILLLSFPLLLSYLLLIYVNGLVRDSMYMLFITLFVVCIYYLNVFFSPINKIRKR